MSGYDQSCIVTQIPTIVGSAASLGGPYVIKPSEAFSGALMTVSGLTGETISVETSPDGYWGAPASPTFYRTDWQGTQLLYSTARTVINTYSEPLIANLAAKSATLTQGNLNDIGGLTNGATFPASAQQDYAYWSIPTLAATTQYAVSMFVKMADSSVPVPSLSGATGDFLLSLGGAWITTGTWTVTPLGSGVYMCIWVGSSGAVAGPYGGVLRTATHSGRGFTVTGFNMQAGATATSYVKTDSTAVTVTDYATSNGLITYGETPLSGALLSYDNSVLPSPYFVFATGDGVRKSFAYDGVWGALTANSGNGNGIHQIDLRGAQAFRIVKSAGSETATINMTLKRDALQYKNTAGTWTVA